jgi:phosphate-selective porin OprO/OprP
MTHPARADDKELINELRARVEALEKQNQYLLQAIQSGRLPGREYGLEGNPGSPRPAPDKGSVQQMAADYLRAQEERKNKEKEKDSQTEATGFTVGSDLSLRASWRYGLEAETADKAFMVHVGGRTQFDGAWVSANDRVQFGPRGTGRIDDAVNFRRARILINGTMYEVVDFNCEYDFLNTFDAERNGEPLAGNTPVPTDLWLTLTHLPVIGNFRAGNMKPPISFEHLTSSRWLNFLERSLCFDAFIEDQDNGFRPGMQIFNWELDERLTWAVGAFKQTRNVFGWNVGDGEYDVTGRVTGLPWYHSDGRCLLHLGVAASHRDLDDDQARLRSRLLIRNGPAVLHTILAEARMLGSSQDLIVPELALVVGPFTLQTEYYATVVHNATFPITPVASRVNRGTAFFQGYYVEVLYFLTGEHRPYNRRTGAFTRVVPHENFFFVPGQGGKLFAKGAWQVGARYSYLDLENKGIGIGVIHDVTLGLNWFLNPNMKVQWNYTWAHRDVPEDTSSGVVQALGVRFAWDF